MTASLHFRRPQNRLVLSPCLSHLVQPVPSPRLFFKEGSLQLQRHFPPLLWPPFFDRSAFIFLFGDFLLVLPFLNFFFFHYGTKVGAFFSQSPLAQPYSYFTLRVWLRSALPPGFFASFSLPSSPQMCRIHSLCTSSFFPVAASQGRGFLRSPSFLLGFGRGRFWEAVFRRSFPEGTAPTRASLLFPEFGALK